MTEEQKELAIKQLLLDYNSTFEDFQKMKNQMDSYEPEPEDYQEAYREWLDENHDALTIGNSVFYPSDIVENCDPTSFRIGLGEFADYEFNRDKNTCEEYCSLESEVLDLRAELEGYKDKLEEYGYETGDLEEIE